MVSPCHPPVERDAEIGYIIYKVVLCRRSGEIDLLNFTFMVIYVPALEL
jgi:hypothetical protein